MAKRCGFPPVYKIERVAKMSVKRAFFSVFQKIMVFCCAIFFGFANAFSANLPSGYTELEYIESTGTQYIDTGITLDNNSGIDINYEIMSYGTGGAKIFGYSKNSNLTSNSFAIANKWAGQLHFVFGYGTQLYNGTMAKYTDIGKHHVVFNNKVLYADNELVRTFNNETFTTGSIVIGNIKHETGLDNTFVTVRHREYTLINNGVIAFKGIPAKRNSDNAIGMYDLVTNTFFTNAGTGEFVAGPLPIKIATTAYNTARFSPVKTDLNSAVATIREIVTKTINQTAAIASLQADKQTRPEDACPAGKKCLLVETEENGVIVPHWFPIIEAPEE